ncbi:DMT family transporter [Pseudonocardia adelaidensis]|uniref:Magnesium transporter NIPA n=1 Tax=Pseudonocardia adelaidensis TaxID=648754 RepID=A0ABP9NG17_9PSEU
MHPQLAVALALASAVCYALSAVLQEREASRQQAGGLALVARLARRRGWWAAIGATGVGALLHLAAVGAGPLVVVQPIGVSTLVIALLIGSRLSRRRVPARSWAGVACVLTGLPAVLAAVPHEALHTPSTGGGAVGYWPVAAVLTAVVALALATALVLGALRRPHVAGIAYAASAAVCFGFTSATAKTIWLGHLDVRRIAVGLVVVGVGTVLAQHAYRDGGLGAPLAVLTLLDPFTAGAVGMLVIGEPFGTTPITLALGVAGGLATSVGVGLLSARPVVADPEPPAGPPGEPVPAPAGGAPT